MNKAPTYFWAEKGLLNTPRIFRGANCLYDVLPIRDIAREEIFGPVISIIRWEEFGSLVPLIHELPYGLTANVWTNDLTRAIRLSNDIKAGYIWKA